MDISKNVVLKENCTGCQACVQICNYGAITVSKDEEGFWKREINSSKCVSCGKCVGICPEKENIRDKNEMRCFLAYSLDDEVLSKSTSGGIIYLIGEKVIRDGGVVFGAVWNEDFFGVHHQKAETIDELHKIQGSKYVQSDLKETYIEAETYLRAGKAVMFSGTSCQIAGLKKYLKIDYSNLVTVDLICRGNASSLAWEKYIKSKLKKIGANRIEYIEMRGKKKGKARPVNRICFEDGKYEQELFLESYFVAYMRNMILNRRCFSCKYKDGRSVADITLGDAQGGDILYHKIYTEKGMSHVTINSAKGLELYESILEKILSKEIPYQNTYFTDKKVIKSVEYPMERDNFLADLSKCEWDEIERKYCLDSKIQFASIDDNLYYKKELKNEKKYTCAYGTGNTFINLIKNGFVVDFCTNSSKVKCERIEGIVFIDKKELVLRNDIFVYITVSDLDVATSIHKYLVKNEIPHQLYMDGE